MTKPDRCVDCGIELTPANLDGFWPISVTRIRCNDCIRKRRKLEYVAGKAVQDAIRHGDLPKAQALKCAMCGKPAYDYHHHRGYDEAHHLDVIPLCRKCHVRLHTKEILALKEAARAAS